MERVLNKMEAHKLSYIEFKIMVRRMLNELSANYKELHGSYKELIENYTSIEKDIELSITARRKWRTQYLKCRTQ